VRLAALLVLAVIGLLPAPPASAHASLIATEPADGAIVSAAPESATLVFNEPVSPLTLRLFDPSGHGATLTAVKQDAARLVIALPRDRGEGTYVLSWRVVSADGHPIGGAFGFSVGRADGAARAAMDATAGAPVRAAIWLTRVALYVALFVGIGGAFFACWIVPVRPLPGRAEPIIVATIWCGLVLLPLAVGLQGLDALGVPLSDLRRLPVWTSGLATSYGTTAMAAALALLAAFFAIDAPQHPLARRLSALALLAVGFALAASGHAAAAAPQWLTRPAVFVHAIAVTFWVGSLLPLAAVMRAGGKDGRLALQRFSRAIPFMLAALIVAGATLAVVQVADIEALWNTAYGLVLLGKLAVVAALLGLAAVNRFYLTPRIASGDGIAQGRIVRSIVAELVLVLAIFGLVASWRFTPPPRALAFATAPVAIHVHGERAYAHVELRPQNAGGPSAMLRITDLKLNPLPAKEVALVLANPVAGVEPISRAATSVGDGRWQVDDLRIPVAGEWRLRVEILVNDFDKITLEQTAMLPRLP
jgi:copper transport protein